MADRERIGQLHESEIAHYDAQAARELVEAEKLRAEAREVSARADNEESAAATSRILYEREAEKRAKELAANEHHHVYVFDESVSEGSVKKCINQLTLWARQKPDCEIELQINSPGGSVIDGFALIDFIRDLREKGHEVTTVAFGMAASMAGVLLQAGDKRVMGANCLLLIHEASYGISGDHGDVEDRVEMVKIMHDKILSLFAERSSLNKAQIGRKWRRKDWWLPAEIALKHGFIDEVR